MDRTAMQRADRIAQYRASYADYPIEYLMTGAKELKLDLVGDETREDLEFAIAEATVAAEDAEAARLAQEEAAAKAKAEREAFYQTKEGRKQRALDEAEARDNAVRRVNVNFANALPHAARMQGSYAVSPDSIEAGNHPVPDGRYRVLGSLWVMSFKDGKWIGADQAHARTEPDWIEIPDAPGGLVGGKHRPAERF